MLTSSPPFPKGILLTGLILLAANFTKAQSWDTLANVPEQLTFPIAAVVDGKIHLMGGGGTGGATSAHYQYDPATDEWISKAPIPYVAQQPAGAAVNGKIHYFGGGFPNSGSPVNDHYIYDPATDIWSQAANLTTPRAIHYGVGLNGLLYSLAGQGMTTLCQTYDQTTNTWTTKNNLPDGQFWYGAHVAANGKIYRFCGGGYTAPKNFAHEYDPDTDTWSALPAFPKAVHGISGAAIGDNIYLAGGYFDFLERDEMWIYDITTQTYTDGTPMPIGRNYHNIVAVDSCIYVIGGSNAIDPTVSVSMIRFCPFDSPSGVEEHFVPTKLSTTYRNGKIIVQVPDFFALNESRLTMFDIAGRVILEEKWSPDISTTWVLDASGLPPSMYFLQLRSEKTMISGKVFINR